MARGFNGSTDKIVFPSSVPDFTGAWTVAFWFKRNTTSHRDFLWSRYGSTAANRQLGLYIYGSEGGGNVDHLQVDIPWIAGIMTSTTAFASATVYHLAVVRSGSSWTLYVNGSSNQTATNSAAQETGVALTLGQDAVDSAHPVLNGLMWEVAGWNVALTAAQVKALANCASPRFLPNGLKFYAPLIGRYGPEIDVVSGKTGTLTGTTYQAHGRILYPA